MARMVLQPWTQNIVCEGRVSYNESVQAWNTIRFKKEFLKEFPQLKDKKAKISFKIEHLRTIDNLKQKVKEIEKNKEAVPMLLYFFLDRPL